MNSKLLALVFAAGSLVLAQGPRGSQLSNSSRPGSGLDMAKTQVIEGTVTAVNSGYASQYPSIQINQTTLKLAPVWFLLENDFEIKVGDTLKVTAAPSLQNSYLCAIAIQNTASGMLLNLRDSAGLPLWTRAAGQSGLQPGGQQGTGTCMGCGGFTAIETVSGVVEQVTAGIGIQMPSLVLKTSAGLLTIKIGPERILEAADFEIKAGDSLTVRSARSCTGETVALELTNASGITVILRGSNGYPAWL